MGNTFEKLSEYLNRLWNLLVSLFFVPLILALLVVLAVNLVKSSPLVTFLVLVVLFLLNLKDLIRFYKERNYLALLCRPVFSVVVTLPFVGLVWISVYSHAFRDFGEVFWSVWAVMFFAVLAVGSVFALFPNSRLASGISSIYKGMLATGVVPRF